MIRLEIPPDAAVDGRRSSTLRISGANVRLIFANEGNPQVTKMVRDTLKDSYNKRLTA